MTFERPKSLGGKKIKNQKDLTKKHVICIINDTCRVNIYNLSYLKRGIRNNNGIDILHCFKFV